MIQVVDTTGTIAANGSNIGYQTSSFLDSDLPSKGIYPTIAYAGQPAAAPTLPAGSTAQGPAGTVLSERVDLEQGRAVATVFARRTAVVLLKSSFDPGWTVTVDGEPATTEMVAPALVGVTVAPGQHTVVFTFRGYSSYPLLFGIAFIALSSLDSVQCGGVEINNDSVVARLLRARERFYGTVGGRRMFRYTMVSVISTIVTFTVLGIVFGVLRLWTEVPSAVFANVVAIIPAYHLNRIWVWGKTGRSHWRREVLPFTAISVVGIFVSIASAEVARRISVEHHFSHPTATALLLAVTFVAFAVLWLLKLLVFNRVFRISPKVA